MPSKSPSLKLDKRHARMMKSQPIPTTQFAHMNHHHTLEGDHTVVELGGEKFVANNAAIPLLKALNEAGLNTRTHHYEGPDSQSKFVSILLDGVRLEVREVNEIHAERSKYNGKQELLISWN